jgi:hypothetical protein
MGPPVLNAQFNANCPALTGERTVSLLAPVRWGSCRYVGQSSPAAPAEVCLWIITAIATSEVIISSSEVKSLIQLTFFDR